MAQGAESDSLSTVSIPWVMTTLTHSKQTEDAIWIGTGTASPGIQTDLPMFHKGAFPIGKAKLDKAQQKFFRAASE